MDNIFYTNLIIIIAVGVTLRLLSVGGIVNRWIQENDTVAVWSIVLWMWVSVLSAPAFLLYKLWA